MFVQIQENRISRKIYNNMTTPMIRRLGLDTSDKKWEWRRGVGMGSTLKNAKSFQFYEISFPGYSSNNSIQMKVGQSMEPKCL